MHAWLVTIGEPLPIDGPRTRLLRTGFLSRALGRRGHQVTWFSNRFSHHSKIQRGGPDAVQISDNERLVLLNSRGYRSNVSVDRFLDHRELVRDFVARAPREAQPDVIVASMPTIDLCAAAVEFGAKRGIPTVIDIRDLWPDSMWDLAPKRLRPLMRLATVPFELQLNGALRNATAVTSHVEEFIDWARRKTPHAQTSHDRVFPLGYEVLEEHDEGDAGAFWRAQGLDLERSGFLVVYVGTISRQCEFKHVIDAAKALESEGVTFVLCGSGDLLGELQSAAGAAPNLIVPGWCTHSQITALLSRAQAGLMPYRRLANFVAAVPNKSFEYMACGVPIVWSLEAGALADLIHAERIGLTYDLSSAGLADAIRKIRAGGDETRGAGERARVLFEEKFQAERIYDQMAKYLESLATQSGRESRPARHATDAARRRVSTRPSNPAR